MRNGGGRGYGGDFNFMAKRNLKIHHIWDRDHGRKPALCPLFLLIQKAAKKKRGRHNPTPIRKPNGIQEK